MMSCRSMMLPGSILVAAVLAAGCSRLPTAPAAGVGGPAPTAGSIESAAGSGPATAAAVAGTSTTTRIQGQRGGTVTAGQFTVRIPPGAFTGQALVTVTQPDPSDPRVDLTIWPAVKNGFQVPVTLVVDLTGRSASQIAGSTVHEWDPVTRVWTPMSRQTNDVSAKNVRAPLVHFSSYRVEIPVAGQLSPGRLPFGGR
jgi:hypothetical protein